MEFKAYIFDLDGTLLDTLPDLVHLTNMVMAEMGWSAHTRDEVLSYVGDGGHALLRRAAPAEVSEQQVAAAYAIWEQLYPQYGHGSTRPYPGIPQALANLREQGAKLGVLSNKFDAATKQVIADHFPGVFDLVCGEGPDTPRKPDPRGLRNMLFDLGVEPIQAAYIGDSATDMEVSNLVGTFSVGVTWGYNSQESIVAARPQAIINQPQELALL